MPRKKRVYNCSANIACPHSTKVPKKSGKGFRYSPSCGNCKAYCGICSEEIKRGEAWTHIPAIGVMHRRDCHVALRPSRWRSIG